MGLAQFDLTGEVALITGATKGIGRTVAEGLLEAGASVAINGRDTKAVSAAVDQLQRDGRVTGLPFDVTDGSAASSAIAGFEDAVAPISILVNNAGVTRRSDFVVQNSDDWHIVLSTNLDSVRNVSIPVVRSMMGRKRGKVVNVCSLTSEIARAGVTAYAATKGAVKMLTRALAVELAPYNIQVNGLGPGYIRTPLNSELTASEDFDKWVIGRTPARRWGTPEDLVGTTVFLASRASDFLTGQVIYVDGGILASL